MDYAGATSQTTYETCPYPDFGVLPDKVKAISPDALVSTEIVMPTQISELQSFEVTIEADTTKLAPGDRACHW
ncbi:hypothetical protein IQ266_15935 [filamentous cyanobacterium LEGE 11480]|uniref:Uncharacterized protein n=1 Tax=Romeriopsis navalis LEGE 11480 TaxID=2777977 RepID=A0A928VRG6_9CYAN|nr:hypothetical protein [Romeriopsis navalis]MBE9031225.1 hypothetical protein [Romeriopsis navalis LEGE 11480]